MADTHQDESTQKRQAIVDELVGLSKERNEIFEAAMAVIEQKKLALQHQCGAMGHVYGPGHTVPVDGVRCCVFCRADEPVAEEKQVIHG